jgi:hypothetical protein
MFFLDLGVSTLPVLKIAVAYFALRNESPPTSL